MSINKIVSRLAFASIVISAVACGDSRSAGTSNVPTAPSAGSTPAANAGSATISGALTAFSSTTTGVQTTASGPTVTISVVGTGISATVGSGGSFVLTGVPAGNVELHVTGIRIDGRTVIADVSDREDIRVTVTVNGSNAVIVVNERKKPGNGVEIEGLIASINTGARTLVVNGTTVSVPADATIRHGNQQVSLSQLKVGQRVHVRGTMNGSVVVASEIKLQDENAPGNEEAEVEGTVSARSGSCPSLTFMVNNTRVATDASTQFKGGACGTIANGVKVEVEGVRQSDSSIRATRVELDKGDDN